MNTYQITAFYAYINTPDYLANNDPLVFADVDDAWDYLANEADRAGNGGTRKRIDLMNGPGTVVSPFGEEYVVAVVTEDVEIFD